MVVSNNSMSSPTHIDEALSELELLRTLTDEQLLEKYSSCFNFEKDFRDAIESGRLKLSAKTLKEDDEEEEETSPLSVEEATKRILEKKKAKEAAKKDKKKSRRRETEKNAFGRRRTP
jgi:hypothetical protein